MEGINYPLKTDDWKKIEKNNLKIALNVSYTKKEKVYPAHISKYNPNPEKKVIRLMISNGIRNGHYIAAKQLSALLRGITSKHHGDFYCLNCLHYFRAVCENRDFCNIVMPSEDTKILEYNQYQKPDKAPLLSIKILNV